MEELPPEMQPHLAHPPAIDEWEAFPVLLFLRRSVTNCARQRRYSEMQGAANLHSSLAQPRQYQTGRRDLPFHVPLSRHDLDG